MPNQQSNQQFNQATSPIPSQPQKPQFNLKYILIVLILAVIAGGGILAYQYWWLPRQETKSPEIIITDPTAGWQVYRNEEYGFEVKYPRDWQFVTDPNFMFTYSGEEGPDFVFELQGKQELLKEFAAPSLGMPPGLKEKYKEEGIVTIIPDLISIMIYKNEKNLSIADFVKEKFGYLDSNFVGQRTLGNEIFTIYIHEVPITAELLIKKNKTIYLFVETISREQYDKYMNDWSIYAPDEIHSQILSTFRFIK